jgi:hypothetical protein
MTDFQNMPVQGSQALKEADIDPKLLAELDERVRNNPDSPLEVNHRTSFVFQFEELIKLGGHLPTGVTYYMLAIVGSVLVAHSNYPSERVPTLVFIFSGTAVISQTIEAISRKSKS